jgi:transposase
MPRPMKELAEVEHRVATLYASLELSQSAWLVTSLSPGSVTMSKHLIPAGDGPGLLSLLARLRTKAEQVAGAPVGIVVIQEAGLDGFWVHRLLEANRIESHVVDAASIAVPRRRRRAKTDAIDGETLLRTLRAWKRGEAARLRNCCAAIPGTGRPTPDLARTCHSAAREGPAR